MATQAATDEGFKLTDNSLSSFQFHFHPNHMNDLADKIEQWLRNPFFDMMIAFFGLGLLLLIIHLALQYRNKKRLCYSIDGCTLLEDFTKHFDELEISFKKENIKNLTVTKIILWNSGNVPISSEDIVEHDPLRIFSNEDVNILDCQVIQMNEVTNSFKVTRPGKNVSSFLLDFDYVDSNQGCVIQVLHDGKSPGDVRLEGKMTGIKKFDFSKIYMNKARLTVTNILGYIMSIIEPVLFGIPFALMISITVFIFLGIGGISEIHTGTFTTLAIVTIAMYTIVVGTLFERKPPKGLERF